MLDLDTLEERYIAFCEKHNLDALLTEEEQLIYLKEIDNTRLYKTLSGLVCPVVKEKKIKPTECASIDADFDFDFDADFDVDVDPSEPVNISSKPSQPTLPPITLKVDTTPKCTTVIECTLFAIQSIRNSKRLKNGGIQYGLAF